jgi:hypothetical protein
MLRGEAFAVLQRRDFVIDRELGKASGGEQKLQIRRRTICRGRARGRRHGLTQHLSSVDAAVFVPFDETAAKPTGADRRHIE